MTIDPDRVVAAIVRDPEFRAEVSQALARQVRLLSLGEVAECLSISKRRAADVLRRESVPIVSFGPRLVRYRADDIRALIDRRRKSKP